MNQPRPVLTEKTAATAWALALNTHDLSVLAPLVHDRLRVTDQRRWDQRVGGDRYLAMLEAYFEAVPRERSGLRMELATLPPEATRSPRPRPCVVEYRDGRPTCTILFQVIGGTIRHIETRLLPPPTDCRLSGIYPGLEAELEEAVH